MSDFVGDSLTNSLLLALSAFKEVAVLCSMQFISKHVLSTLAEECGRRGHTCHKI